MKTNHRRALAGIGLATVVAASSPVSAATLLGNVLNTVTTTVSTTLTNTTTAVDGVMTQLLSQVSAVVSGWFSDPVATEAADAIRLPSRAKVGRAIFHDTNLSEPAGQSCASCHAVGSAFTDPNKFEPTSRGAVKSLSGPRNSPTAAYASFSPQFTFDTTKQVYLGGLFWDGRASTLEQQAAGPFLGAVEMNNPSKQVVVDKIKRSVYAKDFMREFGDAAFDNVDTAYDYITQAVAAYERTQALSRFNSKYDAYLAGTTKLSAAEARGLALFNSPTKGNCAACHTSAPGADGSPPLFTDFTYDNLGVPRNPDNRWYKMAAKYNPAGANYIDPGLGGVLGLATEMGKFKVPTLRNIGLTNAYMHNGYFKSLRGVVDFYNTRDAKPACKTSFVTDTVAAAANCWPAPEVPDTINRTELGNLRLTASEVSDIVTFMGTLTDGWNAK